MSRPLAFVFGLGLVALTAAPGFAEPGRDSFPFSTYPMFARQRGKPQLYIAEGITRDGSRLAIPPRLVANGEVMQALQTLKRAAAAGPDGLRAVCERIAQRVSQSPEHAQVSRVQIVAARFDPISYFEVGPVPEERRVVRRCKVRLPR